MIIAVTNRKICTGDFTERAREILRAGPFLVILREKDLSDTEYRRLTGELVSGNDVYKRILSLNRPNVAKSMGIGNVHLTFQDMKSLGRPEGMERVGVSVHSTEEAEEAEALGADYLVAGHIYSTDCKKGIAPRGIGFLKKVLEVVDIPVFAIGGICANNFREPLENGAYGICMMSELMTCDDVYGRVKMYSESAIDGQNNR